MIETPHLEVPGVIFIILGVAFIVFRRRISAGINALSARIWGSEHAKRVQGFNPKVRMTPSMSAVLGIAWILSGAILLFVV